MRPISRNEMLVGDVRQVLPTLPDAFVDTVITSPPYWSLRNYHANKQIGLERDIEEWVDELLTVMRGLARVLKPSGSVWLNLGDTFSHHNRDGAPRKSLLLGPERLALAMVAEGWTIRSKVIWAKTNPMPTSVRDRMSCTYEVVYFATRTQRYFFDLDAIRVPYRSSPPKPTLHAARRADTATRPQWAGPLAGSNVGLHRTKAAGRVGHPLGKNPGDVWRFATSSWSGEHHAVFPESLIRRPMLASCPERICSSCGAPWTRSAADSSKPIVELGRLIASCTCIGGTRPGLVLDPFMGAGTTAVVAERLNREWLGIELNRQFAQAALQRIASARKENESYDRQRRMAA